MRITRSILLIIFGLLLAVNNPMNVYATDGHDHGAEAEAEADDHSGHAHADGPTVAVSQWTDSYELFLIYPLMSVDTYASFEVHLTNLDDFEPVRSGKVTLTFRHETGYTYPFASINLMEDGIFEPEAVLPFTGKYDFKIKYENDGQSEIFNIGEIEIYPYEEDIPEPEPEVESGIHFLKVQQWKIDFATEMAGLKNLRPSTHGIGIVKPVQSKYAEIIAPVDGVVSLQDNSNMVIPGSDVKAGQTLITLSSMMDGSGSWTERNLEYQQAKRDFERAERLKKVEAISEREFEEIRNRYEILKAGFESNKTKSNSNNMVISTPFAGTVVSMNVHAGQMVEAGQTLMTVVDLSSVWVQMELYERDYYKMNDPVAASISVPGREEKLNKDCNSFELLNSGQMVDPVTRTIPLLFAMGNSCNTLKLGQRIHIDIYGDDSVPLLSVPETSILDDNGQDIVFVQTEGENFEKRSVKTGIVDNGVIAILDGLEEGERVVSKGAYLVKLASLSTSELGHGHTH
jgi:membrane fusion protein, heavy metal efflux system